MKRLQLAFFYCAVLTLFFACGGPEGPPGPTGPPGPVGPQGPAGPVAAPFEALMYEVNYDLNGTNDFSAEFEFPEQDEILPSDVVLVYRLTGENPDIWKPMPVSFFRNAATLLLNYDFTVNDVRIFAEASYPLSSHDNFVNEYARVVVIPAAQSNMRKSSVNYENFEEVKAAFKFKVSKLFLK